MDSLQRLRANIQRVFMGHPAAVDQVIVCLLARGHVLIEDVPGVGKTILATSLARSIDCTLSRLQLTPDLLPADILGVTVWDQNKGEFIFKPGPIFSNIVLADEINRTTPRTQSALLEAMNEAQVSVDGHTRQLVQPFMVIATQNPFEFEGTYFLPESQLDRFLMRIHIGYPQPADEARILESEPSRTPLTELKPVLNADELVRLQEQVSAVTVDESLVNYVVRIAAATREHEQIQIGISPRGSLALLRAARATAVLAGRDYVIPDDIASNAVPVCAHRLVSKSFMHDGDGIAPGRVMQQMLESVPMPE
jgi:MoxR-like ATPase